MEVLISSVGFSCPSFDEGWRKRRRRKRSDEGWRKRRSDEWWAACYSGCVIAMAADGQLRAGGASFAGCSPSSSPSDGPSPLHPPPPPPSHSELLGRLAACWNVSLLIGSDSMENCCEEKEPEVQTWREQVVELLYWRDVKTTGVVFGAALLLLLSLTVCSIVSVCSYIGLALLSVTICFRIYKGILQAIQKSDEGHPFKQYLDQEVALSEDVVHKYSDKVLEKLNKSVVELRRLFLVEDLVDSIKFAVLMWILTYVGALFNGLTLLILGLVGAFSCPIIYEKHQAQIDHYLALVNNQIKDVVGKVQAKVPGLKRKAE
ncbi:reticulon-4a isoform X7 [Cyprinodon tularosa]|nr:reticulon-4a isoform X7 [Cyprinodon tularosa]